MSLPHIVGGNKHVSCEKMFSIIGGSILVSKTIRGCVRGRRMKAKPTKQFIGSLPGERLETYPPSFTFAGVGLFGRNRENMGLSVYITLQLVLSTSE